MLITKVLSDEGAREITIRMPREASEASISRAASLVVHFAHSGRPLCLHGPGLLLGPGRGKAFAVKLLTTLARWENTAGELALPDSSPDIVVEIGQAGEFTWRGSENLMDALSDTARTGWNRGWRGRSSVTISSVSILPGTHRAFKYFLSTLICLSIGAACIENGLHPSVLLILPLVIIALNRNDFSQPFFFSEGAVTVLFLLYVPLFSLGILIFYGNLSLPLFVVYFTFGTVMARVLSPLTDRNVAQLIFLSIGLILINCILTNHLIFGLILPFYLFALMGTLLSFHLARNAAAEDETLETASDHGFRKPVACSSV